MLQPTSYSKKQIEELKRRERFFKNPSLFESMWDLARKDCAKRLAPKEPKEKQNERRA
jgi:hypothetical protein